MTTMSLLAAFLAAVIAGAVNSVAGGGSMISFPVLIAFGIPPIVANATNTVGIWPGALGSLWGFRSEFSRIPKVYHWLLVPAILGSVGGAILLRFTSPEVFEKIVPGLILFATLMFILTPSIRNYWRNRSQLQLEGIAKVIFVFLVQLMVSIYGGYFGAGMSILMLSILNIIGMTDMLEMAAMTSFLSLAINGVAGIIFAWSGLIEWRYAFVMTIGAITGGYAATGLARRVGSLWIRRMVITVGFVLTVVMLIRVV